MKIFSYKKAGLFLIVLGLFSSPSYVWSNSCSNKFEDNYENSIAYAIMNNDRHCAKKLIHNGSDVNATLNLRINGGTKLSPHITSLLDVDIPSGIGYILHTTGLTPLMSAAYTKQIDLVSLLIEKKADPFIEFGGFTARDFVYHLYSKEGRLEQILAQNLTEEERKHFEAQLDQERANGEPDFFDSGAEEIYNMLVEYEASYYN